jgi:hypothetical protein
MIIYYGTRFYGKVKKEANESIQTKFFHIYCVPLIPYRSFYVTGRDGKSFSGFGLKFFAQSVLAGYLRFWSLLLSIGFGYHAIQQPEPGTVASFLLCVGLWIWSMFVLGRRSDRERLQGFIMERLVGFRAMPEWLDRNTADGIAKSLESRLRELSVPTDPEKLRTMNSLDLQTTALAYLYGRFQSSVENQQVWGPYLEETWRLIRERAVFDV